MYICHCSFLHIFHTVVSFLHHPVYCCLSMVRQHEGIRCLCLTTTMKGQITHYCFTQDWHHRSPSIFITPFHTLCCTPSLCLSIPFLLLYKFVTHYLRKSLSQSLSCLSLLSLSLLSMFLTLALFLTLNEKNSLCL